MRLLVAPSTRLAHLDRVQRGADAALQLVGDPAGEAVRAVELLLGDGRRVFSTRPWIARIPRGAHVRSVRIGRHPLPFDVPPASRQCGYTTGTLPFG
jgi:hypothetical protein